MLTFMALDWSYQETIAYLYGLQKQGIKLSLSNSVALMEMMGNPHRKFPSVHVAGTNGKGSTAVFVASMLQAAGYRVGLYTSPHLVDFAERIRINNVPIPVTTVVRLAQNVCEGYGTAKPANGSEPINPTFFEVTTALAFAYFAEERVDIGVIEVGMGGKLDSTNVVTPLVSVITNIDLEHQKYLGNTLEEITAEKAGIIKAGVPVITGAVQPEVISIIEREAAARRAPVYRLWRDFMPQNIASGLEQTFNYRGLAASYQAVRITMLGMHQIDNACLAMAAVECLLTAGLMVTEPALRLGLEQAHWEGRMERIANHPDIYLDGAHNPASAKKLARTLEKIKVGYRRTILVIGILEDKDYPRMVSELVPLVDHVVVTQPQYCRAMDIDTLKKEIERWHTSVISADTVERALGKAKLVASHDDLILVTGSLYVVGEARALFHPKLSATGRLGGLTGLKG